MRSRALMLILYLAATPALARSQTGPEVAKGITLPANGDSTVFALDQAPNGPTLVHIVPSEAVTASHAGTNFLRSAVYAGSHIGSDLEGPHANTSITSPKSVLYVRLYGDDAELAIKRLHLVWAEVDKKKRHIVNFSMNAFGGSRQRHVFDVPSTIQKIEGTNWVRITPNEPLEPGEFAVVVLPADPNQFPSTAYDFSVAGSSTRSVNPYTGPPTH